MEVPMNLLLLNAPAPLALPPFMEIKDTSSDLCPSDLCDPKTSLPEVVSPFEDYVKKLLPDNSQDSKDSSSEQSESVGIQQVSEPVLNLFQDIQQITNAPSSTVNDEETTNLKPALSSDMAPCRMTGRNPKPEATNLPVHKIPEHLEYNGTITTSAPIATLEEIPYSPVPIDNNIPISQKAIRPLENPVEQQSPPNAEREIVQSQPQSNETSGSSTVMSKGEDNINQAEKEASPRRDAGSNTSLLQPEKPVSDFSTKRYVVTDNSTIKVANDITNEAKELKDSSVESLLTNSFIKSSQTSAPPNTNNIEYQDEALSSRTTNLSSQQTVPHAEHKNVDMPNVPKIVTIEGVTYSPTVVDKSTLILQEMASLSEKPVEQQSASYNAYLSIFDKTSASGGQRAPTDTLPSSTLAKLSIQNKLNLASYEDTDIASNGLFLLNRLRQELRITNPDIKANGNPPQTVQTDPVPNQLTSGGNNDPNYLIGAASKGEIPPNPPLTKGGGEDFVHKDALTNLIANEQNANINVSSTDGTTTQPVKDIPKTSNPHIIPELHYNNLIEQIAQKARAYLHEGRWDMKLRLDPPELGHIKLKFSVTGNRLEASIEVENLNVMRTIEKDITHLRESISSAGINVERLDVFCHERNDGHHFAQHTNPQTQSTIIEEEPDTETVEKPDEGLAMTGINNASEIGRIDYIA